MFHLTMLGSGSAGNATLVKAGDTRILVDAGLSARQIQQRLAQIGCAVEELDGILLTHEHQDHAGALGVLSRRFQVPVYCNTLTAESLSHLFPGQTFTLRRFQTGASFAIRDAVVQTFSVPHDAVDPVGFSIRYGSASIGFLTDLGHATKLALERVRDADALVIETNHDEKLLQECSKRPWSVKQRILSRHGHLSNAAAARVIADIAGDRLKHVLLCHLSRDCNAPELAIGTVEKVLRECGNFELPELVCASQAEVSPTFTLSAKPPRHEQATFGFETASV